MWAGALALLTSLPAQLLHHSSSPDGPWIPVIPLGCNGSTGIWRDGGGGNQSPFFVTEAVARLTGLPNNSIVAITMFSTNTSRGHPSSNATLNAFMAVGIAKTWHDPMVIRKVPLFLGGVLTGWEDPYMYFDLQRKRWRVLYHEITGKPNACKSCGQPMPGISSHCGGFAESTSTDIWGDWVLSPPQIGAYTLDIDFAGLHPNRTALPATSEDGDDDSTKAWQLPRQPLRGVASPLRLGRSFAAYANASLTSWGGNAVKGDDGLWHLYTSAMSYGRNNNAQLSDLIPGPCVINVWERNSFVLHAVATSPTGPYTARDVALPSSHTNPQIMRTPDGEYLLYSCACCSMDQYSLRGCAGCHKGQCGPERCSKPSAFPPLPAGNVSLWRRERPKIMFDSNGKPTHLWNSADPGNVNNRGWTQSRAFTMVTEILG
jgi:hypothetical protein